MEAGKEKEEWRYSTMAAGELFVMTTGIYRMLASFVANWDFLLLLVLRALHALVLEAVKLGWTMCVVPAVKIQLKIVGTMGGAQKAASTVKTPR